MSYYTGVPNVIGPGGIPTAMFPGPRSRPGDPGPVIPPEQARFERRQAIRAVVSWALVGIASLALGAVSFVVWQNGRPASPPGGRVREVTLDSVTAFGAKQVVVVNYGPPDFARDQFVRSAERGRANDQAWVVTDRSGRIIAVTTKTFIERWSIVLAEVVSLVGVLSLIGAFSRWLLRLSQIRELKNPVMVGSDARVVKGKSDSDPAILLAVMYFGLIVLPLVWLVGGLGWLFSGHTIECGTPVRFTAKVKKKDAVGLMGRPIFLVQSKGRPHVACGRDGRLVRLYGVGKRR